MTPCDQIDLDDAETDHVFNRPALFHGPTDFHIQMSDTGRRDGYPGRLSVVYANII